MGRGRMKIEIVMVAEEDFCKYENVLEEHSEVLYPSAIVQGRRRPSLRAEGIETDSLTLKYFTRYIFKHGVLLVSLLFFLPNIIFH